MKQLIILHGALGSKTQFTEIKKLLSETFEVYCLEFEGHGSNHAHTGNYSMDRFAEQTQATLRALGWEKPLVFGYSMGGYVALKLESSHPNTFERIVTLGTKFNWNQNSAQQEARMLNPEKIQEKVPAFAYVLQQLHGETEWKSVVERTAAMMLEMGKKPPLTDDLLERVAIPVTCLLGEKDVMVNEEETLWAVNHLTNGVFEKITNWQHPIDKIPASEIAVQLTEHLN